MQIEAPFDPEWTRQIGTYRFLMVQKRGEPYAYITKASDVIPSHWEFRRKLLDRAGIKITKQAYVGGGYVVFFGEEVEDPYWSASTLEGMMGKDRPEKPMEQYNLLRNLRASVRQCIAEAMKSTPPSPKKKPEPKRKESLTKKKR